MSSQAPIDVACLGILIADVFPTPVDSLPAPGDLKVVESYLTSAGGCAANTAACLARLGFGVKAIGKVGHDLFGDFVVQDLQRLGVDASSVRRSSTHVTSNTYIVNVRGEDRRYFHCIGANADFTVADVDFAELAGARALYVGGYMVLPGVGVDDLAGLFREAKQRAMLTLLDVVIGAGKPVSLRDIAAAMPYTDVFLPNDDEARALTGESDPEEQAAVLSALNPRATIAITLGSRGCLARTGGVTLRAGSYQVDPIDESGAGDAFTAGFAAGLLKGWPLERVIRFASAVGASCTRALGCTAGVFQFEEAERFAAETPLAMAKT